MFKRIATILLSVCMCFSFSSVAVATGIEGTTYATTSATPRGGTETWSKDYDYVGSFLMEGNNLTPVKNMGRTGQLYLVIEYEDYKLDEDVNVTVQIKNASTGKVLAQHKSLTQKEGSFTVRLNVTKGQKIQVFFRVTDKNGNYNDSRKCAIKYWYGFN